MKKIAEKIASEVAAPVVAAPIGVVAVQGAPTPRAPAGHIPHLNPHGGPLLTSVEVSAIFWGPAWQQPAHNVTPPAMDGFFDFILTSTLMDVLREYSVPGQTTGYGRRVGTWTDDTSNPGTVPAGGGTPVVQDTDIQKKLTEWIKDPAHPVPMPTTNTLYFVYLPPNVIAQLGKRQSCRDMCGYHSAFTDKDLGTIVYAVVPFPDCAICQTGVSMLDRLTEISSHELCEAITDPDGSGWFDDLLPPGQNEIGDICSFQAVQMLASSSPPFGITYNVQSEWSNHCARCMIAGTPVAAVHSSGSLNFPSVVVGNSGPSRTLTVTNTGTAPLFIADLNVTGDDGDFSLYADTCTDSTLDPGQSCTVTVSFEPTEKGPRHATLAFDGNDCKSPQLSLSGTGRAGPNN